MKDFRTWMNLRESAPVGMMRTADGHKYQIEQSSEESSAIIDVREHGEDVETKSSLDEFDLGNNEYASGTIHLYGIYSEEHEDEGPMYAGTTLTGISVYKSEIKISDDQLIERPTTDEDLRNILVKLLSSEKSIRGLESEFDR